MVRFAFLVVVLIACYGTNMQIQGECAKKYKNLDENHSQCLTVRDEEELESLSDEVVTEILDRHNKYRSEAEASNMMEMKWDDKIADSAMKYAQKCPSDRNKLYQRREPGEFDVGQNYAKGLNSWTEAIDSWASQKNNFPADRIFKEDNKDYYQYSQIVWAKTSLVGCGRETCPDGDVFVCNYAPGGNYKESVVYEKNGEACSECGAARCSDNLCDCGADNDLNACMNLGTLNLETCECNCFEKKDYGGEQCQLTRCPPKDEEKTRYICQKKRASKKNCREYFGTSVLCPNTCNTCESDENKENEEIEESELVLDEGRRIAKLLRKLAHKKRKQ